MDIRTQEDVKKRFDEMFKLGNKPWRGHPIEPLFDKFFTTLSIYNPNAKVLDIGCGDGWASILTTKHGFEVWGIDSSPTAIEEAKAEAQKEKMDGHTHFQVGDALRLSYESDFFDAVIDGGLFHHILPENRPLYLENILKVLKKDGLLYLNTFSSDSPNEVGFHFTKEEIEDIFGKNFKTLEYEKDEIAPTTPFTVQHFILKRVD